MKFLKFDHNKLLNISLINHIEDNEELDKQHDGEYIRYVIKILMNNGSLYQEDIYDENEFKARLNEITYIINDKKPEDDPMYGVIFNEI